MPLVWPSLSLASAIELPFHLVHKSAEGFGGISFILRPWVQFRFMAMLYLIIKFIFYFILSSDSIPYLWPSSFWLRTWPWLCNMYALLCDKAIVELYHFLSEKLVEKMVGVALEVLFSSKKSQQCCLSTEGVSCISHWVKAFFALSFLWCPAVPN